MKLIVAERAGFCFGVKRAVEIAFEVAEKKQGEVCTLGPIIHNPQVVKKLSDSGVFPVESIKDLKGAGCKTVIIRTHGIPVQEMQELEKEGYIIIDATCPFVKKAQHYAKLLKDEGYKVLILGDRDHPEVKGIMSFAGEGVTVVSGPEDLLSLDGKVGIVVQTTQQIDALRNLLSKLLEKSKDIKVYNTICNSTALRLKETEAIASTVDVMVIVGGKNSANTTQLASLCKSLSVPTYHIETVSEIRDEWFRNVDSVGITAGASTPDWIIEKVVERINTIGNNIRGRG